jgi:hypothetical protein
MGRTRAFGGLKKFKGNHKLGFEIDECEALKE